MMYQQLWKATLTFTGITSKDVEKKAFKWILNNVSGINYQSHSGRLMRVFILLLKGLRETFIIITSHASALP